MEQAVVTPRAFRDDGSFSGEVFRPDGTWCELSLSSDVHAGRIHRPPERPPAAVPGRLAGRHLYVGDIFEDEHRDLMELTGRLWPLLTTRYDGVVAQIWRPDSSPLQASLSRLALDLLSAFGVRHAQIHMVAETVRIERLDVPEAALRMGAFAMPVMRSCFRHVAARLGDAPTPAGALSGPAAPETPDTLPARVFLSPTLPLTPGRFLRRNELTAVAVRRGFAAAFVQDMPIGSRIAIAGAAELVAGLDAPNLSLTAFCRPGTTILSIGEEASRHQRVIEALCGLKGIHVALENGQEPTRVLDLALKRLQDAPAPQHRKRALLGTLAARLLRRRSGP